MIWFWTENLSNLWDIHLEIRKNISNIRMAKIGIGVYSLLLKILKNPCQMLIDFCLNIPSNRE